MTERRFASTPLLKQHSKVEANAHSKDTDACALPKNKLKLTKQVRNQTLTKNAITTHILDMWRTGITKKERCAIWTTESGVNPTNNAMEPPSASKNTPTSSWKEIVSATCMKADATAEKNQRTTSVNSVLM